MYRQGIDDGGEHAHVVGCHAIKFFFLACLDSAEDVAAADHDCDFDAQVMDFPDLGCNSKDDLRIDTECLIAHQRLAAEFQQNAFVLCGHLLAEGGSDVSH